MLGDSMIPGTLIPILLAIGMSLSSSGSPIGAIFYIVAYTVIILALSYWLFMFGYRYGTTSMRQLAEGGFGRVTASFAVLGLVVAGGIGAAITALSTPLAYSSGELTISVQSTLDGIFPKLLPLLLTLWLWYGMRRRGWPINRALFMVFIVTLIGYLPGLLGTLLNVPWLEALRIF